MNKHQKQISKEISAVRKASKLNYKEAKKKHKEQVKIMEKINLVLKNTKQ